MTVPNPCLGERRVVRKGATHAANGYILGVATGSKSRLESLDLIRGVAIVGIPVMNVIAISGPHIAYFTPFWRESATRGDLLIYVAQSLFVESRLMSMLNLLFGAGLAIQMDQLALRGDGNGRGLRRRLLWLLFFGFVHGFVLWDGDILVLYALSGLVAMHTTRWRPSRLFAAGAVLVGLGQLGLLAALWSSVGSGANVLQVPDLPYSVDAVTSLREQWTALPGRIRLTAARYLDQLLAIPLALGWHATGLSIFGIALYRLGAFSHSLRLRLPIGLIGFATIWSGGIVGLRFRLGINTSAGQSLISAMMLAGLSGGLGYALLLVRGSRGTGLLVRAIRNAGRTAFTIYLGQTLVTLLVFVALAPHLWGSVGRPALTGFAAALGATTVVYGHQQQTRWGQGPFERLWRWLAR